MSSFVYTKWLVWKWALYFLIRNEDSRIFHKKRIICFSNDIIPILRLEKALGFTSFERIPKTSLTKREDEVMALYFFGHLSERAVGRVLGISRGTVRSHKNNALAKVDRFLSSFAGYKNFGWLI